MLARPSLYDFHIRRLYASSTLEPEEIRPMAKRTYDCRIKYFPVFDPPKPPLPDADTEYRHERFSDVVE